MESSQIYRNIYYKRIYDDFHIMGNVRCMILIYHYTIHSLEKKYSINNFPFNKGNDLWLLHCPYHYLSPMAISSSKSYKRSNNEGDLYGISSKGEYTMEKPQIYRNIY